MAVEFAIVLPSPKGFPTGLVWNNSNSAKCTRAVQRDPRPGEVPQVPAAGIAIYNGAQPLEPGIALVAILAPCGYAMSMSLLNS